MIQNNIDMFFVDCPHSKAARDEICMLYMWFPLSSYYGQFGCVETGKYGKMIKKLL